jgi:hypothetical protein
MPWAGMAIAGGQQKSLDVSVSLDDVHEACRAVGLDPPTSMFDATFEGQVRLRFRSDPYGEEDVIEMPFQRIDRTATHVGS